MARIAESWAISNILDEHMRLILPSSTAALSGWRTHGLIAAPPGADGASSSRARRTDQVTPAAQSGRSGAASAAESPPPITRTRFNAYEKGSWKLYETL